MEHKANATFKDAINEKLNNRDYTGARMHLLETIKTFPTLQNASEMLALCEILCSASASGTSREIDWYRVLQVLPIDAPETVEAQYKDMISALESVKGDVPGAALAMRYVEDAYNVLSDSNKRADFNARRKGLSVVISGNRRKYPDLLNFDEEIVPKRLCSVSGGNFECDQVWLCYDRCTYFVKYAQIISFEPEQAVMKVNWYKPCPKSDKEKIWCDSGLPVSCGEFIQDEISLVALNGPIKFSQLLFSGYKCGGTLEMYPKKGEVWAVYKDWDFNWDLAIILKCELYMVEVISNFSEDFGVKVAYLTRVQGTENCFERCSRKYNGFNLSNSDFSVLIPPEKLYMFSRVIPAIQSDDGKFELDKSSVFDNLSEDFSHFGVKVPDFSLTNENLVYKNINNTSNSKFSSRDFSEEQVWAIFSAPDSMPRSYVKIINVISETHLRVSFLEPHPMNDEEIQWIEEDLIFSCGVFRKSADTFVMHMSNFSHTVKCDYSAKRNFFRIFPRKGEIWATCKNRIKSNKSDNYYYRDEFRMVEILSDYISDERRINVGSLTEIDGSLTFFQRQFHDGFRLTKSVTRSEMLGFSHRVPAYRVTGHEGQPGLPEVLFQLEPSALPPPKAFF